MGLDEYHKKREFSKTPEPEGTVEHRSQNRFVVQRHEASRLHYDLRLEIDGTLKSWAVPKGPSMNPDDKRLAIHTEDHPIQYLTFQGIIPKGNYGAGKMQIWDTGTFSPLSEGEQSVIEQYDKGNIKIVLNGNYLKGGFVLIRTSKGKVSNQWLLIKLKDDFSLSDDYDAERIKPSSEVKSTAIQNPIGKAGFLAPMLANTKDKPFNDENWIFELKWDGYRSISTVFNGTVKMYSRNGVLLNQKFKPIAKELSKVKHDAIFDGEIVALDKKGLSIFQGLQSFHQENGLQLRYYVFDLLHLNGHSLLELTLVDRKSLLPQILEGMEYTFFCDHVETEGKQLYSAAVNKGMEGIVAKKKNSIYLSGTRSPDWLKIKKLKTTEAVICGWTNSEKSGRPFGSLILGAHTNNQVRYIGNCGTGFSLKLQKELLEQFKKHKRKTSPFAHEINLKGRKANWVEPQFVCEVSYSEFTQKGLLRHPVFVRIRPDKTITELNESPALQGDNSTSESSSRPESTESNSQLADTYPNPLAVNFSNLDKIYFPKAGLRKYDVIDYYQKVAKIILPYQKDRPQNLHRHPEGIKGKGFYQKNIDDQTSWLETLSLYSESSRKEIDYLLCQNEATLLHMANMGCIELNPWNSRKDSLEKPDYTVIDIDPSNKSSFAQLIDVVLTTQEVLQAIKIKGYCKTSGGDGLHVYIPLGARYTYDQAREFTLVLCKQINERLPKITTLERMIKKRGGKIYLDYLQNRKGQSLASAYSIRPREGAPVSAPLHWSEVNDQLRILDFNLTNMPERIIKQGDIFSPVLSSEVNLSEVLSSGLND